MQPGQSGDGLRESVDALQVAREAAISLGVIHLPTYPLPLKPLAPRLLRPTLELHDPDLLVEPRHLGGALREPRLRRRRERWMCRRGQLTNSLLMIRADLGFKVLQVAVGQRPSSRAGAGGGQPVRTATGLMSGLSHARVGVAQGERERALLPWREPAVPVPAAEGLAERLPQWRARRKAPIERVLTQLTRSGRSIARPHRRGREAPDIRNSSARRKGSVPRGRRRRSSRDSGSGGDSFKHAGRFGKASRDSSAAR